MIEIFGGICLICRPRHFHPPHRGSVAFPDFESLHGIPTHGLQHSPWRRVHGIWLCYIKDLSYEEIVQTLEVPMGTVKTWLNRARRQLGREFRRLGLQAA